MHKLRIVLVTLITVCFLSACSTASKMPDNDDLLEMLPQDLIESSIQAPIVTSLSVEKSLTEERNSEMTCRITFTNDVAEMSADYVLYLTKYDDGTWQIDSWTQVSDKQFIALEPIDEQMAINYCMYGKDPEKLRQEGCDSLADSFESYQRYTDAVLISRESDEYNGIPLEIFVFDCVACEDDEDWEYEVGDRITRKLTFKMTDMGGWQAYYNDDSRIYS